MLLQHQDLSLLGLNEDSSMLKKHIIIYPKELKMEQAHFLREVKYAEIKAVNEHIQKELNNGITELTDYDTIMEFYTVDNNYELAQLHSLAWVNNIKSVLHKAVVNEELIDLCFVIAPLENEKDLLIFKPYFSHV